MIYNIKRELSIYPQTIQTLNFTEHITGKKLLGDVVKIKKESNLLHDKDTQADYIEKRDEEYTQKRDEEYTQKRDEEYTQKRDEESIIIKNEGNPTIKIIIQKEP